MFSTVTQPNIYRIQHQHPALSILPIHFLTKSHLDIYCKEPRKALMTDKMPCIIFYM
jgi:hypothetical protein